MVQLVVVREDERGQPIDPNAAPREESSIAAFLRSKDSTLRHRQGVFHGQREEYFKGAKAVSALLKRGYAHKSRPTIADRQEARQTVQRMIEEHNFFFRVKKQPDDPSKTLEVDQKQYFEEEAYYVWQWESPWTRLKARLYSGLLILVVLAGVMFPLWPVQLRVGVWYLSMGALSLLGALLVIAIVRLIGFVLTMGLPFTRPGLWLFPNLFADVGVVDSFIPVWGWHGVDYETMHLDKYRKQKLASKKKKKSSSDGNNNKAAASNSKQSKGKQTATVIATASDSEDEEPVEEIEAEPKPKSQ